MKPRTRRGGGSHCPQGDFTAGGDFSRPAGADFDAVFPEGQTREQTALNNVAAMSSSQQGAVAVALDELDLEYEPVVMIAGVEESAPADGTLEGGDVIVSVAGESADDVDEAELDDE